MSEPNEIEAERVKQSFLTVIKWCSRHAGARIVFDTDGTPKADIQNKIIHMPKKIAIKRADSVLGTLIHESMHIKHTPKWLGELCRDPIDHHIINALEDHRIEDIACKQLRALDGFLVSTVQEIRNIIKDPQVIPLFQRVLSNIAAGATNHILKLFDDDETKASMNQNFSLLRSMEDIFKRVFSVTRGNSFEANVQELYEAIDEFRRIYGLPPADPTQKQKMEAAGMPMGIGPGDQMYGLGEGDVEPAKGCGSKTPSLNMEDLNPYLIDLNAQAKERIKETLKKSLTVEINEGMVLNTDNLTSLLTGDIDDVFHDTKSERKMRTKLYFLMDISGSMGTEMSVQSLNKLENTPGKDNIRREELAISAFTAISEVINEVRNVYGTDIDYDNYVFADDCKLVETMSANHNVGGGTNLPRALKQVLKNIHEDDPANKRILVILTDGDVGNTDELKKILQKEAQDIRIVFVGITESPACDLIRHNIIHEDHGEAKIIEAMEEAL